MIRQGVGSLILGHPERAVVAAQARFELERRFSWQDLPGAIFALDVNMASRHRLAVAAKRFLEIWRKGGICGSP